MMLKIKVSIIIFSFMDLNEPSKFGEDYKDDVEGGVLDLKFLVCDVHDKGTKLDMAT